LASVIRTSYYSRGTRTSIASIGARERISFIIGLTFVIAGFLASVFRTIYFSRRARTSITSITTRERVSMIVSTTFVIASSRTCSITAFVRAYYNTICARTFVTSILTSKGLSMIVILSIILTTGHNAFSRTIRTTWSTDFTVSATCSHARVISTFSNS